MPHETVFASALVFGVIASASIVTTLIARKPKKSCFVVMDLPVARLPRAD